VTATMRSGALAFACLATWAVGCGSRTGVLGDTPLFEGGIDAPSGGGPDSGTSIGIDSSVGSPEAATPDGGSCAPGQTLCAGACVDEQTDNANCGGCGVACGGTCAGGRCVVTLSATGVQQGDFTAIAVDSTSVYWTSGTQGPPGNDGEVMKVPLGGGAVTTLASGQATPWAIALDSTSVYWLDFNGGSNASVVKVPLQGGLPTTLASAAQASGGAIAVDSTRVYWGAIDDAVLGESLSGGTPTTIAIGARPSGEAMGVAVDATNVYWTNLGDATIRSAPLSGGTGTQLARLSNGASQVLAADATSLYLADCENAPGTLVRVPKTGGAPVTLASGFLQLAQAGGMAVDATNVYYANFDVAHCGFGNTPGPCDGAVMKVPINGGTPVTIAALSNAPLTIAVDATSVYWVSAAGVFSVTPK
jgi:hypothetical protein